MLTPEEIQSREFLVSLRGYDRDEVHAFLDEVAEAFSQLLADGGRSGSEGSVGPVEDKTPDTAVESDVAEVEPEPEVVPEVEPEPTAAPEPAAAQPSAAQPSTEPAAEVSPFAAIGAETQRILEAAAEAGDEIRRRAQSEADEARASALAAAEAEVDELRQHAQATQSQIEVLEQRRGDLTERLRQARETVDLALLEVEDTPVETVPADATNSVLAEADEELDKDG